MVARVPTALLLLLTALLAGCAVEEDPGAQAADAGGDGGASDDAPTSAQPAATSAPASGPHGQFKRAESAVSVRRDGDQYVASKTVTFTNGGGDAGAIDLTLTTVNGGVTAADDDGSGYDVVATLQGRGSSEQAARDNLARLKVEHSDKLASGRLTLATEVVFPSQANGLTGSLVAKLPAKPDLRVTGRTVNGGVSVEGLSGPAATLSTTNGGVALDGDFTTATLTTSNGGIEASGAVNLLRATTTNGGIDVDVAPTASGSVTLETTNGPIEATVRGGATHGFDAEAGTSNGSTDVTLDGGSSVGAQTRTHKHVRTDGYDGKSVRVTVDANAVNGDVAITQA